MIARKLIASLLALLATVGGLTLAQTTASALGSTTEVEQQFFDLLNAERAAHGKGPLARDPGLDAVARSWSGQMSADNTLKHRPDLAAQIGGVEPAWQRGGENVGTGGEVQALHNAFVASKGHFDNIVGDWNRLGVGVVISGNRIWVTFNFLKGPDLPASSSSGGSVSASAAVTGDLWLATANGEVYAFGQAPDLGDLGTLTLNKPIVGMAPTATGQGYWLVASDGGLFAFGDAGFYGSTGDWVLPAPVTAMAATPTGQGYWMVGTDGSVYAFGDARDLGGVSHLPLNSPINGIAATPSGNGYWLVAGDGGMFSFGDAGFHGSTGGTSLSAQINGVAATPSGNGYWLVGADGKVYPFGDAGDFGSANAPGATLSRIATTPDGRGYRMAASDGRIFSFGSAGSGSSGPLGLRQPVVAIANFPI